MCSVSVESSNCHLWVETRGFRYSVHMHGAAKSEVLMRWDGGVWGCVWAAWVGSRLVQEMGS